MSGRILVVDSIPTNRIVMRVKLISAQYIVETCQNQAEARLSIAANRPDLILINLFETPDDGFAFCEELRAEDATRDIAIIATGSNGTAQARFRALDAGADDVLPRPMNDALLLARVRNLMRRRLLADDLMMRDSLASFGFEEEAANDLSPYRIALFAQDARSGIARVRTLQAGLRQPVHILLGRSQIGALQAHEAPDLFVLHGADGLLCQSDLIRLVCDLKSRAVTCRAAQVVIVPAGAHDLAAMLLDLGAADVVYDDTAPQELVLRVTRQARQKRDLDQMRDRLQRSLQAAVTDPLTGLHNRRYAETELRRIGDRARRTSLPYAVLLIDIDHFKSINDRFGHAAGDMVLTQLSDRLRGAMREIDLLARIGGEGILVALPETDTDGARLVAERLREEVRLRPFDIGSYGPPLTVTISVGASIQSATDALVTDSLGCICARADAALYSAKSAGRDAVSMDQSAA